MEKALVAVKSNAEYFEQKGQSPDRLIRACHEVIKECGVDIPFEYKSVLLPDVEAAGEDMRECVISAEDLAILRGCNQLPNKEYARTIMDILERYQVLSDEDIKTLLDKECCGKLFSLSSPMLLEILHGNTVSEQIKALSDSKKRFYSDAHILNGRTFVMSSELWGREDGPKGRDNRTPLLKWILEKFEHPLVALNGPHECGVFNSWEIFDENTVIKHCDKTFFGYRNSGVPREVCRFFNVESLGVGEVSTVELVFNGVYYQGKIRNESSDRHRFFISWGADLSSQFDSYNVPEATATFRKIADGTYEITMKGGEKEMTIKEKVAAIKAYIAARGFNYEGDLIENFYLSLKSKPFVILAGTSGTGKTRLVKLFAEAIGAQMKLVPVRPDWSDSSDLFGHTDLSNEFHPGAIIDFIKQAEQNEKTPHFICLDEMNLARVEYYLSDILSIIETRDRRANGRIETDPLLDETYFKKDADKKKYGRVFLPDNLYIIGTVNMDETTFPFSKKVLDRANTIEFSFVDLMSRPAKGGVATALQLDNSFLKTEYLYLPDCDDEDLIEGVCLNLGKMNDILLKANLHVGYRIRDEICFYMMNNKKADLLTEEAALDHEIMQKILPRIQGSSGAIKEVLSELFKVCAGDYTGFNGSAAYEQMDSYLDSKSSKYPNSAKKIAFMMRRYEEDGFTSYWL